MSSSRALPLALGLAAVAGSACLLLLQRHGNKQFEEDEVHNSSAPDSMQGHLQTNSKDMETLNAKVEALIAELNNIRTELVMERSEQRGNDEEVKRLKEYVQSLTHALNMRGGNEMFSTALKEGGHRQRLLVPQCGTIRNRDFADKEVEGLETDVQLLMHALKEHDNKKLSLTTQRGSEQQSGETLQPEVPLARDITVALSDSSERHVPELNTFGDDCSPICPIEGPFSHRQKTKTNGSSDEATVRTGNILTDNNSISGGVQESLPSTLVSPPVTADCSINIDLGSPEQGSIMQTQPKSSVLTDKKAVITSPSTVASNVKHTMEIEDIITNGPSENHTDFTMTTLLDKDTCTCSSSLFSGEGAHFDLLLPKLGLACKCGKGDAHTDQNYLGDEIYLSRVLRPWQVQFLESVGITTAEQLVQVGKAEAKLIARQMRSWRKGQHLIKARTKQCYVALQIWARTAKVVLATVRKQEDESSTIALCLAQMAGAA